jgi:hypothetical protein
MTRYLEKAPFAVGPKSSKVAIPCTAKIHAWPIRDGKGGYKCWYCQSACTVDGKSVEGKKNA